MNSESYYQTLEELQDSFKKLKKIDIQSTREKETLQEILTECFKIQKSIQSQSLFSKNESLEDINIENVKFIELPYLMGQIFNNIQENRVKQLNISEIYFNEYIKIIIQYELLDSEAKLQWKQINSEPNYQVSRESKINNFRKQKDLKQKIDQYQKEGNQLEYYKCLFTNNAFEILNQLVFIKEEKKMLDFKQQMDKDQKLKEDYENRNKNIPKLQSINIPKLEEPLKIKSEDIKQQGAHEQICGDCMKFGNMDVLGMNNQQLKQELRDRVFQPGHSVPTMRLEDFANQEMAFMEQQEKQKQKNEEERLKNQVDSDKEEYDDQKLLEKRAWDDWKDDHEKGAGNKMKGR